MTLWIVGLVLCFAHAEFARRNEDQTIEAARRVLNDNWNPSFGCTVPSTGLYPEQWSWDSMFIAIGRSTFDVGRAHVEILSLFEAQWSSGLLPHMRFNPKTEGHYFPGSDWWQSWRSKEAPEKWNTSGIIDPPVHATAVATVFKRDNNLTFAKVMYPKLKKWHEFLIRERTDPETSLIWIRHPWASGMDNAASWDQPLKKMGNIRVPFFNRTDCPKPPCPTRPTEDTYEHYIWLVVQGRESNWNESALAHLSPFRIADVALNSIWVQANEDLAILATELNLLDDAKLFLGTANETRIAMRNHMWNESLSAMIGIDLANNSTLESPLGISNIMGLIGGSVSKTQATAMVPWLNRYCENIICAPSLDPHSALFDPVDYWRGPTWINTNYLLVRAIDQHYSDIPNLVLWRNRIMANILELPETHGMREYFNPKTGEPLGAFNFSWTAALYLASTEMH